MVFSIFISLSGFLWGYQTVKHLFNKVILYAAKVRHSEKLKSEHYTSELLSRKGIDNEVIVLIYSDLRINHAICIWKGNDGTYSFISNEKLYKTNETDLERAVIKFFPDCVKILKYSEVRIAWRQ